MPLTFLLRGAARLGLLVGVTILAACGDAAVTLEHVHGLAFSPDGQQLSIPSHHGLAVYSQGRWSKAPINRSSAMSSLISVLSRLRVITIIISSIQRSSLVTGSYVSSKSVL